MLEWTRPWAPPTAWRSSGVHKVVCRTLLIIGDRVGMPRDVVVYMCSFLPDDGGACWDRECLLRSAGVVDAAGLKKKPKKLKGLKLCKCGVARYCSQGCKKR